MCSSYRPTSRTDRLLTHFGAAPTQSPPDADVYPTGLAPFIRNTTEGLEGGGAALIAHIGHFGLLPPWNPPVAYGRRTYNARSETVGIKPSFREAWRAGRRCIIPADHIYEPSWATGQAVRWRIQQQNHLPMGIAGIYGEARGADGRSRFSFAMLTANADGHPIFQNFHRPADEKRMVAVLQPADYLRWLSCTVNEAPRYLYRWDAPMDAAPDPAPRTVARRIEPTPGLFDD